MHYFGIHILVHKTSRREVNKRERKSLSVAHCNESGEEKESAGLKALAGAIAWGVEMRVFEIYVSAANTVKHTVSSDIVTGNDIRIPIFAR